MYWLLVSVINGVGMADIIEDMITRIIRTEKVRPIIMCTRSESAQTAVEQAE